MLAAENNYVSEDADDNSTAYKDEDKTIASALNIPYRYTKGFYSLHTGYILIKVMRQHFITDL